jgi:glucose/arabinose dehydrogenase
MRFAFVVVLSAVLGCSQSSPAQVLHTLHAGDHSISLSLPEGFDINVAASGLPRVRFLAQSPDGRIFATGMYNLADNTRGSIYILDGWDARTGTFGKVTHYLDHLRNPNSIAFWTDPRTKQTWLYVALTDKLLRYKYQPGDSAPSSPPETLIRFPDYGLSYKYGGWHLTRTIAVGKAQGRPRIFVAMGSSCNYCQETEVLRASVLAMDPDGSHPMIVAQGLRNAVGLAYIRSADSGSLFATNMGDDHLGDKLPEDTFFQIDPNGTEPKNFGWPTCYFAQGKPVLDKTPLPGLGEMSAHTTRASSSHGSGDSVYGKQTGVAAAGTNLSAGGGHAPIADTNADLGRPPAALKNCTQVPPAYATFAAHSSPLGFEFFTAADPFLHDSFLVALHGAGHPRVGTGYRVIRISTSDRSQHDFITGFLTFENGRPVVHGRPCGLLRVGPDSFLLTDDYLGLIYYIHRGPAVQR